MLTLVTRLKVAVFVALSAVVLAFIAVKYADLGRFAGFGDYYLVKAELARTGNLYENAAVTYRGVSVGRVGEIHVEPDGVVADLKIDNTAPPIPADTQAHVLNLSAVGEQYLDLRPNSPGQPYLRAGSRIAQQDTFAPTPVTDVLQSVSDLAGSVPMKDTETFIDELGNTFQGQGPNLQALLDEGGEFVRVADANIEPTKNLIYDGNVVLRTQNEHAQDLKTFAAAAKRFTSALKGADTDLEDFLREFAPASRQLSALQRDLDPDLAVLIANLTTTADLTRRRTGGLEELMVQLPKAVAAGKTSVRDGTFHFGQATTFFNPLPCVSGYHGTRYRNGLDVGAGPGLNIAARCALPASTGVNVRGSENAPRKPVPDPAEPGGLGTSSTHDPGMPGALGLPSLPPRQPATMRSLLGLEAR